MKTHFTKTQLAEPQIAEAADILQSCQHFGFCTSGCPTYVLLHDENDGPRGRIDLIKEMLESSKPPAPKTVMHLDRCMSCMSCMTTCAVKVDYMHLIDVGRAHIERTYRRPMAEKLLRDALGFVLPRRILFRHSLALGRFAARFNRWMPSAVRPLLELLPPPKSDDPADAVRQRIYPAEGPRRWRVALLEGCVQPEIAPHINAATIRMLTRFGCEVVMPEAAGCCGSLNLHMGKQEAARSFARSNIAAWLKELDEGGLDAILVNASGCGTTLKDYGHLLKGDPDFEQGAQRVAALAVDVCEWLVQIGLPAPEKPRRHRVTYHDACSLRNAQKVTQQPRDLLQRAGYQVFDVPEAHFCCGSAGTYNMLQPDLARQLGQRKAANLASTQPQIVAAGNIGCITQIGLHSSTPTVHTVELLDWAYGGPPPLALRTASLEEVAIDKAADEPVASSSEQPIHFHPAGTSKDMGIW
jgi:glycolate oxidase iron-sulfur subunit